VPSDERSAPEAPSHLQFQPETNPDRFPTVKPSPDSDLSITQSTEKKLLPRETGHDIGMGSPVPLSSEAVGVITRLRNMKVCTGIHYLRSNSDQ
jgi:tRNA pseudouridine synthase 9